MMPWLLSGLGLLILLLGGDVLVRGAVNLSLRLGVPALIVSLTIVAFGTSAPELLISIKAILNNAPGIALGNVVGSNTANILMVLGIPALFATMHTSRYDSSKTYLHMLGATVLFIALAFTGEFNAIKGMVLLVVLVLIMGNAFREARAHIKAGESDDLEDIDEADPEMPYWRIGLYLLLGLIGLPLGANILVDSATVIARTYGVTDTVIGLTLVAVGTSLPELATTLMAALRQRADVALGNVIGSNMFNLLAIIGIATLFGPIAVDPSFLRFDLWVMLAASLLMIPFVFLGRDITRAWGVALTALYAAYIAVVLLA
ncbi:MAG: calcium/sodium antiporter [Rhodobacteraceae bacterium]|nr:calcium/sodium antiporter [Paracoccaceae bacterium]